jgi:hypothetical protein
MCPVLLRPLSWPASVLFKSWQKSAKVDEAKSGQAGNAFGLFVANLR